MTRLFVVLALVLCISIPALAEDFSLLNSPGHFTAVGSTQTTFDPGNLFSVYRFDTNMGSFDTMIYDQHTPITATNFEGYADGGTYTNNMFHRNLTDMAVQGGSFYDQDFNITPNPTGDPIPMEWVGLSNVRGTIAMARTSELDSATSGWFFSTADNSTDWDEGGQFGPYAVFGEVLYDGMTVLDEINSHGAYNLNQYWGWPSAFQQVPLIDDDPDTPEDEFEFMWLNTVTEVTGLTYEVVSHTLGADVTASVVNGELVMDNTGDADARGTISLRGIDASGDAFLATLDLTPTGDVNYDGHINAADIDAIAEAIRASSTDLAFDLNGDNVVDEADCDALLALVDTSVGLNSGTTRGDMNLDGAVDAEDSAQLDLNYNGTGNWADGDLNGDGVINLLDLNRLTANFGADLEAVPEPATIFVMACGTVALIRKRRPRK
jgi:peptidyl-prolyl cis-trans isomerase A (cyclophilin A)